MLEKSYTVAEVATNNGKNGSRVWIIIKGGVYDVTEFLDKHPGGGELITEFAGKDATKAFNQAGHSSDASKDLKKYRIGVIGESLQTVPAVKTTTERSYTPAEVANNNGKNGSRVWIIIKGGVYDVTEFLDKHPGGGELITEYAGKDATKAFNQAGHSSDASKDLKKYRIGVIGVSLQTVPAVKTTTERSYTPAEVANNNGKNGSRVWIIIKEVVYDVTDFLDKHPGGGDLITEYAGKDATKAFNQAGHSSDASRDLKKYRIGTVAKKSPPLQVESTFSLKDNGSQATLFSTKSGKRRRIKFLFCV